MSVPDRIGRYHVLGRVATGGMAELLLGKVVGPSGFERPVVIKRILPQYASDPDFVSMFLDEARIAVAIRHPNVVQVEDLGQEGTSLFLVMEYLNGETLGSLMRRLVASRNTLELGLAAHIAAEAAAGLHAAHELVDATGKPAHLVHRDISPDNLFVTYDGTVKVLDFGIARAAGRLTKTRTGALKGKFAYMSPEQCRGRELDARSDLFSLGVVLYEISTGERLFKRDSELAIMYAVASEPIPPPSSKLVGYPEALQSICMRALERDREARYPSAKDMRADLLSVVHDLLPREDPADRLRQLMQSVFADAIREKSQLIRQLRSGLAVDGLSALSSHEAADSDVNTVPATPPSARRRPPPEQPKEGTKTERPPAPPRPPRARVPLMSIVIMSGVGGMVWYQTQGVRHLTNPLSVNTPAAVMVRVETMPMGAKVLIDGVERGRTPLDVPLARSDKQLQLQLELDGYIPLAEMLKADRDVTVRRSLVPRARRR